MDAPNRFEQLVAESQASVMVFGNADLTAFEFLELGTAEVEAVEGLVKLGWSFVSVIGTDANGVPKVALNIPFDRAVMTRICDAFVARVQREWFGASELERLFGLPDTRTVN